MHHIAQGVKKRRAKEDIILHLDVFFNPFQTSKLTCWVIIDHKSIMKIECFALANRRHAIQLCITHTECVAEDVLDEHGSCMCCFLCAFALKRIDDKKRAQLNTGIGLVAFN